ncbi:SAM domain-containing protein [Frigoriflavimonas asaccharolytica]|uniref:Uncharacterized protein n=1 Tax=Frigoriflavimonas asaccharolytica TaxID=2735899 RepID=A0A8J8GCX6_9FLAO|nr:DinB family protein [Frigoriflavimonas asaccharolytica]NRS93442.1 hypothetical protein [Frigoriflavimonas asaccharolytica]
MQTQISFLEKICIADYIKKIQSLGYSSIDCHTRHIAEFLQIAVDGYDLGIINYDHRKRNLKLENEPTFAADIFSKILNSIEKPNKHLELQQDFEGENIEIQTTYFRELLYNIEHCIHHQPKNF